MFTVKARAWRCTRVRILAISNNTKPKSESVPVPEWYRCFIILGYIYAYN